VEGPHRSAVHAAIRRGTTGDIALNWLRKFSRTASPAAAGTANTSAATTDQEALLASLSAMAWVVEARDPYTGGHLWRVSRYAALLCQRAGISTAVCAAVCARVSRGLLDHIAGHSDDSTPLQHCLMCGPTLVVRREQSAGASVFCRNCGGAYRLDRSPDDRPNRVEPTGRQKDIPFSSRVDSHAQCQARIHQLRHIVREQNSCGCGTVMLLMRLVAPRLPDEDHTKDMDFNASRVRRGERRAVTTPRLPVPCRPGT
jgi:hypothetical protein